MPTIKIDNVTKYYPVGKKWFQRKPQQFEIGVKDVNLTIDQGEFVFVIGSSGAGISTLLQLIAGQIKPTEGNILLNGISMHKSGFLSRERFPLFIGYVPQYYSLDDHITIRQNLEITAKAGAKKFGDRNHYKQRIKKVLGLVGLPGTDGLSPLDLSETQRRRIELARALINSPPILILDEITDSLDADSMWDVFLLLSELNRKGTTIIMSTHNSDYVNMLRHRVITLVHGQVYSDEDKGRYGEFTSPLIPHKKGERFASLLKKERLTSSSSKQEAQK